MEILEVLLLYVVPEAIICLFMFFAFRSVINDYQRCVATTRSYCDDLIARHEYDLHDVYRGEVSDDVKVDT